MDLEKIFDEVNFHSDEKEISNEENELKNNLNGESYNESNKKVFVQKNLDIKQVDLLNIYKQKYANIDMQLILDVLEEYFSFTELKEKQKECLIAIKNFNHVLNIMPTGSGKSLIYQIIPLIINGISIVISPLISLIEDQILCLKKKNIIAVTINSSLNKKENESIMNMLKGETLNNIKILYITPEMAINDYFLTVLEKNYKNGNISLIAIDEAHCISSWGFDFRKSYRNLKKILNICPYVRIYICTATATKCIENDILMNLNLNNKDDCVKIIRSSFNRPNIKYNIIYSDLLNIEKKESVYDIIKKKNINKIGIIYCFKRETCEEIEKYLRERGLLVLCYHAGMSTQKRKKIQKKWVNGKINILVATIAFGMGIDRKNVSFIIHFNIPKSIENYYQETGRSGRNGNISYSYLYYSKDDIIAMKYIINKSFSNKNESNELKNIYEKEMYNLECIHNICITDQCIRTQILKHFGEVYKPSKYMQQNTNNNEIENYCCSYCFDPINSKNNINKLMQIYNTNDTYFNYINKYNNEYISDEHNSINKLHYISNKNNKLNEHLYNSEYNYKVNNKTKNNIQFKKASTLISDDFQNKVLSQDKLENNENVNKNINKTINKTINKNINKNINEQKITEIKNQQTKPTLNIRYFVKKKKKNSFGPFIPPKKL